MLKVWHINLKKTKIYKLLALFLVLLTSAGLMAFSDANLQDNANLVNRETRKLIVAKNGRYLQTKEKPQITVLTVKRLDNLTPKHLNKQKRQVYIVVGSKGKSRNVQIYSSADLHSAFTAESRMNIIRSAAKDLRSQNKATFNKGLRFVFKACATRIDHRYQYSLDKYDLSNSEQQKIDHPNKVALPIALAIAVLVSALIYFLHQIRRRNPHQEE